MAKAPKFYQTLNQAPRSARQNGKYRRTSPPAHGSAVERTNNGSGGSDKDFPVLTYQSWASFTAYEPKPPTIPYAGIRTGEIIGHRLWWVLRSDEGELSLCSLAHKKLWLPDETVYGDTQQPISHPWLFRTRIFGGVYAFAKAERMEPEIQESVEYLTHLPEQLICFDFLTVTPVEGFAVGTIKMWGDVIEHETGYRAEYAKLNSIDKTYCCEHLDALRARYLSS